MNVHRTKKMGTSRAACLSDLLDFTITLYSFTDWFVSAWNLDCRPNERL